MPSRCQFFRKGLHKIYRRKHGRKNALPSSITRKAAARTPPSTEEIPQVQGAPDKPYATEVEMWNEALSGLTEPEKLKLDELHTERSNCGLDGRGVVEEVVGRIETELEDHQHDGKTRRIAKKAARVLQKFIPIVDVAVSYDPVHAAIPWAVVRAVIVYLQIGSALESQLLAGLATIASLLAQCHTYQQIYMACDLRLRPPEEILSTLKKRIVETYQRFQQFSCFAMQHRKSWNPSRLGDAEAHVDGLFTCEKQLSLAADGCERHCGLQDRSSVQEYIDFKTDFEKIVKSQLNELLNYMDKKQLRETLDWVSTVPHEAHHESVRVSRTTETCNWLLDDPKFLEWENASSPTMLWLQGYPGTGKTHLTSKVIDHVRGQLQNSPRQEGFAFFYCNRNEEIRRQPVSVLRSYVRQLSGTMNDPKYARKELRGRYEELQPKGLELNKDQCAQELRASVDLYARTTLVIDALDECDRQERKTIFDMITDLMSTGFVRVFVASRPDHDIREKFGSELKIPNIVIEATTNRRDIEIFVDEEIGKHEYWNTMGKDLQLDIVNALLQKNRGMFLWASLQIKEILQLKSEDAIRAQLTKLPDGLEAAYDQIYNNIKAGDRVFADNACKWVASARSPLNTDQLLYAIRLDSKTTSLELSGNDMTESKLLDICSHLLVVDLERKVWRFSHLSVAEYLEEKHWSWSSAHSHTAVVCLKVLITAYKDAEKIDLSHEPCPNASCSRTLLSRDVWCPDGEITTGRGFGRLGGPLERYARAYWLGHIRTSEAEDDATLIQLLKLFLGSPKETSPQYRLWWAIISHSGFNIELTSSDLAPAHITLFAMCHFQSHKLLQDWWESQGIDLSITSTKGLNSLELAVKYGCEELCEMIITQARPYDLEQNYRKGLLMAASRGQVDTVKLLVDKVKAEVNIIEPEAVDGFGSLLVAAAIGSRRSHNQGVDMVEFLVTECNADANMEVRRGSYGSALAAAASGEGGLNVVQFLVDVGKADVNMQLRYGEYGSALAAAAESGCLEIVQFLLDVGKADVNMQLRYGEYGSALAAAAESGCLEIVQFLLDVGKADVNMQLRYGEYGSALAAAAESGRLETVQFLVDVGKADVNMQLQCGSYGSALAAAAVEGDLKVVQVLVNEAGADVDMQLEHGKYGSALAAAAGGGNLEVVSFLVSKAGNDVNMQLEHRNYGRVLAAATERENLKLFGSL